MKKILFILGIVVFASCSQPVLEKHEYVLIDTLEVGRNGFGRILSYDVVIRIKEDSSLHYGSITTDGELTDVKIRPIKNY